ncbi:MAG: WS/DGAT domain-containing protein, partial [Acidimicrobiales bacterium]
TEESPDAEFPLEAIDWSGEQPPSNLAMLQTAALNLAANPVRGARLSLGIMRDLADAAGLTTVSGLANQTRDSIGAIAKRMTSSTDASPRVSLPITPAPATPWNKTVTPHRRFAMRSTSLENLKRLKDATGGTLNDVVMAICTGALRAYLIEKDALPDEPLRAMVPVSIRTGNEADPWTNRVSALVADLPTNCADPIERVALCREAMNTGKHQFDMMPAEALGQSADYASPLVATSALRLVSRLKLADRVNSPINVVISNVPGPAPRCTSPAPSSMPTSRSPPSAMGSANITVHSYADRMDFGLIADRDLVPDLWHLVDLHIAELERLFEATGAEWAVPNRLQPCAREATASIRCPPPPRRRRLRPSRRQPLAHRLVHRSPRRRPRSAQPNPRRTQRRLPRPTTTPIPTAASRPTPDRPRSTARSERSSFGMR